MTQNEKKDKRVALVISVSIHGALLIAFLFLMAWRAPDPPLPEYGIELNFGLDDQGTGEVQPENPVGEELPEESENQNTEQQKEQATESAETQEPATSTQESPVVIKETKEPVKEPVKEPKKNEKTKETETKKVVEKENVQAQKNTEAKNADDKNAANQKSHGDDAAKQGDKGNAEGKIDANALYGKQGGAGGEGYNLSMSGWAWASPPNIPSLQDSEGGRIEFEIECDENGEIVGVTTIQRGLSPKAEQLLKDEIRRNSLIRTSAGKVPERSKGRVVFLLKSR